jgi:hypothetical protein
VLIFGGPSEVSGASDGAEVSQLVQFHSVKGSGAVCDVFRL